MKGKEDLENYHILFDQAPDGMYTIDSSGGFLLVNNHLCQSLGYSRDELLQLNIRDTYLESEMDLLAEPIRALHIHETAIIERSLKRKNGTSFYAQINLKIIDNRSAQGIVREVRLQKELSEQLDNNEERFRQIAEHIRDVFFLIDLSTFYLLYISPTFERLWDQPLINLLVDPASWMKSVHPEDRDRIMSLYYQQLKTGIFDARFRIILRDNSIRWIHARTFPIYNQENRLYRAAGIAEDISEHMHIMQERLDYTLQIERGFTELIVAMSTALEFRDAYTAGHQNKVCHLAKAISEEMNLPAEQIQGIELASQVHDIGKIGIPYEILTKPTKLSKIEYELIKTHPQTGYDILKGVHFPWPIAEIVWQHHERLDGSGYPRGLKRDAINLEAKIIAVADTVDAMSSHRPYRPALGIHAALAEIQKFRGIHFDETVVDACQKLFLENKIDLYHGVG